MALLTGSGVAVFEEACFNIPTLGTLYKLAAADAMTRAHTARNRIPESDCRAVRVRNPTLSRACLDTHRSN